MEITLIFGTERFYNSKIQEYVSKISKCLHGDF